jgi:general L-amino acid transport system permease protein
VVSAVGIVFSLPLGVLLALGRRSKLPIVRLLSVVFIEFVRGVPLITVLFMANTMLPLFLPEGVTVDRLVRPLVGVAIFSAAYMAEVVRGGLQAIPKGQYEGAMSLGLGYWKMMIFIVLPQALRIVIPGIVNTFIGLFKDTTLVAIVGIFDLIRTVEVSRIDPVWAAPTINFTGYAFAAAFYFVFCFGMSRYSMMVEHRLAAGDRR